MELCTVEGTVVEITERVSCEKKHVFCTIEHRDGFSANEEMATMTRFVCDVVQPRLGDRVTITVELDERGPEPSK